MKYKSLFVSDLHLGLSRCKIKELLSFLDSNEFENIFLVGDIFDWWKLSIDWVWEDSYNLFIQKIFSLSLNGLNIYYSHGNHDDIFDYLMPGNSFVDLSNIAIAKDFVYESDYGRILITHGDKYDNLNKITSKLFRRGAYLSRLGFIKQLARLFNELFHEVEKRLFSFQKKKVSFKDNLINAALDNNCSAVICGHLHSPEIDINKEVFYMNCGDYLDKQTCIVEDYQGSFKLLSEGEETKSVQMQKMRQTI